MFRHIFLAPIWIFVMMVLLPRSFCKASPETKDLQSGTSETDWKVSQPEKRSSWQNFQGSWGKRDSDDFMEEKRNWNNFRGSWGKRDSSDFQDDIDAEEIAKRAGDWSKLAGTWGKRFYTALDHDYLRNLLEAYKVPSQGLTSYDTTDEDIAMPFKRDWSKFTGSWGKRPYAARTISPRSTNWSSLRGSWGKRAGDWSQLRGGWGKRTAV